MKIVGVTACTAGIAHTYIVAQKIQDAAEAAGHECKIETQGTMVRTTSSPMRRLPPPTS